MGRSIGAVVAGIVVQFLLITIVQAISTQMYPMPEGMDPMDMEAMSAYVATMPLGAFLMVLLSYALGALGGAFTAAKIAGHSAQVHGGVVWGLGLLSNIFNLTMIAHPLWFSLVSSLSFPALGYLGALLGSISTSSSARRDDDDPDDPTTPFSDAVTERRE